MQQYDVNSIMDSLKNNNIDNKKVSEAMAGLSEEQKKTLDELMRDPELLKKFTASPKAQSILAMLKGEKR